MSSCAHCDQSDTGLPSYPHEVLGTVLAVRSGVLSVLLTRDAAGDQPAAPTKEDITPWALPGGGIDREERLRDAIRRHLGEHAGVEEFSHLEQLVTHSAVDRHPGQRVLATAYLILVPADADPPLAPCAAWHPVHALPSTAFDHALFVQAALDRLRAKLSYTNIGFALAPAQFSIAELRDITSAALGYSINATNLQRVLTRRRLIEPTGERVLSGPDGGRPATLYRFTSDELVVSDPFAVLRPRPAGRSGERAE